MRSQQEIMERIKRRKELDLLGFEIPEYADALTKENVEKLRGEIIKEDADLSGWEPAFKSDQDILERCKDYMPFAWDKANGCRGISANRSIMHYIAWLWLLGYDEFDNLMDDYEFYGKPQLVRICNFLGLDSNRWDDGIRKNTE